MSTYYRGLPNEVPFDPTVQMSDAYINRKLDVMAALITEIQDNAERSDLRYDVFELAAENTYYNNNFITWLQFACDLFELTVGYSNGQVSVDAAIMEAAKLTATYAMSDVYNAHRNIPITPEIRNALPAIADDYMRDAADIQQYIYNKQPVQAPTRSLSMRGSSQQSPRGAMGVARGGGQRTMQLRSNTRMSADIISDDVKAQAATPIRTSALPVARPIAARAAVAVVDAPAAVAAPVASAPVNDPTIVQITADNVDMLSGLPLAYDSALYTLVGCITNGVLSQAVVKRSDKVEYSQHECSHLLSQRSVIIEDNDYKATQDAKVKAEIERLMAKLGAADSTYPSEAIISDITEMPLSVVPITVATPTKAVYEALVSAVGDDLPTDHRALSFTNISNICHQFDDIHEVAAAQLTQCKDFTTLRTSIVSLLSIAGPYFWANIDRTLTTITNRVMASVQTQPYVISSFTDDIEELMTSLSNDEHIDYVTVHDFLFKEIVHGFLQTDYSSCITNCSDFDVRPRYLLQLERILLLPVVANQLVIAAPHGVARLNETGTPDLCKLIKMLITPNRYINRVVIQTLDGAQLYVYRSPLADEYVICNREF